MMMRNLLFLLAVSLAPWAYAAAPAVPRPAAPRPAASRPAASRPAASAAATQPSLEGACRELLSAWQDRLERDDFSSCIAAPFVLAGDMPPAQLQAWRRRTVIPAASALAKAYFKTPPDKPVLILLFGNEKSYREHAERWFGDTDVSYYGYFRHDNIMLMNIATGGGTLVHEMVHALLRPDFPACPDWVNEGLGSLYEQSQLEPLRGLANWRLPALQEAIRKGELRSLKELIEDDDFYGKQHVGMNYAQARYLLMYLQERGKLKGFYTTLREQHEKDATGLQTLQDLLGDEKLDAFEARWRSWVLRLRFE